MEKVVRLTDKNFADEVVASDLPVLVEFWASWCPPCKMMEPMLKQLAADYAGRLKVGKINTDQNPHMASRYSILGVPTFIIFAPGESDARGRCTGAQSRHQLLDDLIEESEVLLSGESTPSSGGDEYTAEDEEQIQEQLRALGYID